METKGVEVVWMYQVHELFGCVNGRKKCVEAGMVWATLKGRNNLVSCGKYCGRKCSVFTDWMR